MFWYWLGCYVKLRMAQCLGPACWEDEEEEAGYVLNRSSGSFASEQDRAMLKAFRFAASAS